MNKLRDLGIYEKLARDSGSRPPLPDPVMREFLKQHLTEKQNGCLQSVRLQEVVAQEKWSLGES